MIRVEFRPCVPSSVLRFGELESLRIALSTIGLGFFFATWQVLIGSMIRPHPKRTNKQITPDVESLGSKTKCEAQASFWTQQKQINSPRHKTLRRNKVFIQHKVQIMQTSTKLYFKDRISQTNSSYIDKKCSLPSHRDKGTTS